MNRMDKDNLSKEGIVTASLKDLTANLAPLGLLGFGMTTVLLNIHNAGFISLNAMILARGIEIA
jgi:succinate-acetate transporter protein